MECELCILATAAGLGLVHIVASASAANRQTGLEWNVGPRDEPRPVTGVAARLQRAQANFFETFPIYAALILVAALSGKLGDLTLWGSALYLIARVLYLPLYAFGVKGLRSIVWAFALVGIIMVAIALFQ